MTRKLEDVAAVAAVFRVAPRTVREWRRKGLVLPATQAEVAAWRKASRGRDGRPTLDEHGMAREPAGGDADGGMTVEDRKWLTAKRKASALRELNALRREQGQLVEVDRCRAFWLARIHEARQAFLALPRKARGYVGADVADELEERLAADVGAILEAMARPGSPYEADAGRAGKPRRRRD